MLNSVNNSNWVMMIISTHFQLWNQTVPKFGTKTNFNFVSKFKD